MTSESRLVLTAMTLLIAIGSLTVFSASLISIKGDGLDFMIIQRHFMWIGIGLIACVVAAKIDIQILRRHYKPILIATIVLLLGVLIPGIGSRINGAQRWIRFAGFGFQPSEFAKIALLLYTAVMISKNYSFINDLKRGLMPILGVIGGCCFLILLEPDVGTALFTGSLCMCLFLIIGVDLKRFLPFIAVIAVILLVVAFASFDHMWPRIQTFLHPEADMAGKGYQIYQSKIALASGGFWGSSIGAGTQKLFYLPACRTDFILAIVGEEMGLLGILTVIGLFMMFVYGGMKIALRAKDMFSFLLASGLTLMVSMQAVANIAVVSGSIPTKGISLPFVSFGGSNLVAVMIVVGLLYNLSNNYAPTESQLVADELLANGSCKGMVQDGAVPI